MELAEKLKAIRIKEGLTQSELCEATGLSLSSYKKIRAGTAYRGEFGCTAQTHESRAVQEVHAMANDWRCSAGMRPGEPGLNHVDQETGFR